MVNRLLGKSRQQYTFLNLTTAPKMGFHQFDQANNQYYHESYHLSL